MAGVEALRTFSALGSLVTKATNPSTSPVVTGVGSNCAGTLVIDAGSRSLALRNAVQTLSLVSCTPIFLPTS